MEAIVMEVLGPYALESVNNDLKDENVFFCLQTDASNKKNIKLFPLVVQYFSVQNGIQNKLLDFYENANESADGMFMAIKNSMDMYKIPFISGLSADNTNSNFGVRHSLYTNMVDIVPDLIKGNCHAHIVHNSVKHGMNFLSHDVENVILKIYSHFSVSACRREELKKFVAIVEGDFHEIKRHIGTRWLSLLPCIDTILLNCNPIRDYFRSLGDDCPMIIQNLLMLNSDNEHDVIETYLHFSSHILNIFNKTIKALEGNSVTIVDVFSIMDHLRTELLQRKNDKYFGYATKRKLKPIEESSPDLFITINRNFKLFIEKCLIYLEKWFDFSNDNWLFALKNIYLKTNIEFCHLEQIIEGKLNLQRLNINMDSLYSEIVILKEIYVKLQYDAEFSDKPTAEKWQIILKKCPDDFFNLRKIVCYILSVPATSAFTERVFSVMNAKWREERNL